MDTCARGLKAAAKMVEDGVLTELRRGALCRLERSRSPEDARRRVLRSEIEEWVRKADINPQPKSGRQAWRMWSIATSDARYS
jgi:xylose isomerase